MTPKEKADELATNMYNQQIETPCSWHIAKYDALIAVDEILAAITFNMHDEEFYNKEDIYWQQVKKEIELL